MNHETVVQRFAERKTNRQGEREWQGSRVFSRDRILYSYGYHFPLAVYLAPKLFLKNGDRYSVTTSGHQAITDRYCKGPTVSFRALKGAGILPTGLTADDITDYEEPIRKNVFRKGGEYFSSWPKEPWTPPNQGMFIETYRVGDIAHGYWHVLGAALLRGTFLCSLDEGSYFVSQLRRPAKTVRDAFRMLKPIPARKAEQSGLEVPRQGEWFFIPVGTSREIADQLGWTQKKLHARAETKALPVQNGGNLHVCRQVKIGRKLLCKGMVRHVNPWNRKATGEHKAVRLGDVWHRAVRNTEVASWSVGGRFD